MRIVLLVALSTLVGCASAPEATTTTANSAAASSSAPVAAPTAAPESAPAAASAAKAVSGDKYTPPPGYKARVENGQTLYCRKITVLGSRFPKDVCMTETQLRDHEANKDAFGRDKDQSSRVCAGGGACQAN